MSKKRHIVVFFLNAVMFLGSPFTASICLAVPIKVFVSIAPQKYFVHHIGKELVDVQVMVQPGSSPTTYEPKPKQMADLSKTEIYFATGVPFEKAWLKKIAATNPELKVVHTDREIQKIPMAVYHRHKDGELYNKGEHSIKAGRHQKDGNKDQENHSDHGLLDPHVWLSPPLVQLQAGIILKTLQEVDPFNRILYETNYNQFVFEIEELDNRLKKTFASKQGLAFMVFHPAWGYFAHAYGLKQVSIEMEGKAPKPAQLKALIEYARERGIRIIIVQPQISSKNAELLAREIGGHVVLADPLSEDWLSNLREVADKINAALR